MQGKVGGSGMRFSLEFSGQRCTVFRPNRTHSGMV